LAEAEALPPGRRIGPYEVEGELGRGGSGGRAARGPRGRPPTARRSRSSWCPRRDCPSSARQRFLDERQILAGLEHPNIARLLDGGETEDGLPYLVMELVTGERIDRFCDARRLPIAERVRLFTAVARRRPPRAPEPRRAPRPQARERPRHRPTACPSCSTSASPACAIPQEATRFRP
jgi:hypothetical protein